MKLCGVEVGIDKPLFLIAGPDTLESQDLALEVAGHIAPLARKHNLLYIFKGSFDKANRSSHKSYRGPGLAGGLKIMEEVKKRIGVPVLTDVHEDTPLAEVASVIDVIQTPAFLCRQTNFMQNVAKLGKPVNVKKGQFMSPWEMGNVIEKMTAVAPHQFLLCERGFSFGYNNLVADMRGLAIMRKYAPVVFDCTHTVQAGRSGHGVGRDARDDPGAVARCGRGWRGGPVHGDAPGPGLRALRRPQLLAARAARPPARNPGRGRSRGQAPRTRRGAPAAVNKSRPRVGRQRGATCTLDSGSGSPLT
jgi:2-dehydro-3-deoxyphosphooctonate aldolase (KDO 8-P synthase)